MRKLTLILVCMIAAGSTVANADEKLVNLVKKIKPCVVLIQTFDKDNKPIAQGSGFFIDNNRLITNHHVIEGAYSATIKTSAGKEYPVQGIVGKDTGADIVKLVVNISDANITFLKLSVNVPSEGEDIVVIGNPLGFESTISNGIVSAVRDIPDFGKILQITAPISPGSSGSPVINSKGEVIGIATLVLKEGQNLNFAIPSDKIIALKETAKAALSESYSLLAADANDAQSFYDKGLKELWQENWSTALTFFQKATEKNPQHADAWFQVGYCYSKLGRHQEAIEAYKQAIRIKPDYAMAHYNLGNAYGNLGRYQEAIEAFKQAIRIKPDDAETHYNLGVTYGNLGRYQEAIEAYKQAIRIKPDLAEAHLNLGLNYLKTGDKGSALEEYKILKTLDAERANKLFNFIYAEDSNSISKNNLEELKAKAEKGDPNAQFSLGFAYAHGQGVPQDYQEAIKLYKKAAEQGYAKAQYNLGVIYENGLGVAQDYQEAIKWYKKAAEQGYAGAQYNLGVMYDNGQGVSQDYQNAIKLYKKAAEQGMPEAQYNLGVMYDKGEGVPQDYNEAVKWYKKAAEQGYAKAHYNLGNAYVKLDRFQEAIEAYKQAIKIEPDKAEAHFALGLNYLITGDKGSALEEYKILKTLDAERANKLFNFIYK